MSNFDKVKQNLNDICANCEDNCTESYMRKKCNIGYAIKLIELKEETSVKTIDNGVDFVPSGDTRYYDLNLVTISIANILKLCKQCNEGHNENCVLSLCRRSLESVILKENVIYPGNALSYIVNVSKQNQRTGQEILDVYKNLD